MKNWLWVAAVVAGCSDDANHRMISDAPAVPPDEKVIDGPDAAQVQVKVIGTDGSPAAGATVYFMSDATTVVATKQTGTDGIASAALQAGYVTLIVPTTLTPTPELVTWGDVKANDKLVFSVAAPATSTVTFTLPAFANAGGYRIQSGCGDTEIPQPGGTGPFTAKATFTCAGPIDLTIESTLGQNALANAYVYVPNQAITDGSTVDLSALTYSPIARRTYTFNNNALAAPITVTDSYNTAKGHVFAQPAQSTAAANPATITIPSGTLPAGAQDLVTGTQVNGSNLRLVETWSNTAGSTFAMDWGAALTPDFATAPAYDVAGHAVNWTSGTAGVAVDFSETEIRVTRANSSWLWLNLNKRSSQILFPVLPDAGATYMPLATDTIAVVQTVVWSVVGGYDAVRANLLGGVGIGPTGTSGTNAATLYRVRG